LEHDERLIQFNSSNFQTMKSVVAAGITGFAFGLLLQRLRPTTTTTTTT